MSELAWILAGGFAMSAIALVGGLTTLLRPSTLERLLLPMVALAAGTLLGGAVFHMIPNAAPGMPGTRAALWALGGFVAFLLLEQLLGWHHAHGGGSEDDRRRPMGWLILVGDGVHNFIGGIGVASVFLVDPRAGMLAWLAAAAHEIPQELGDFGVLVHAGWPKRRALLANLVSALSFPLGALVAWSAARQFELDVAGLALFAAGNFIYIAASDLVPEIKRDLAPARAALHLGCLLLGLALMYAVTMVH
jgi:zinc and cadmium transporter